MFACATLGEPYVPSDVGASEGAMLAFPSFSELSNSGYDKLSRPSTRRQEPLLWDAPPLPADGRVAAQTRVQLRGQYRQNLGLL